MRSQGCETAVEGPWMKCLKLNVYEAERDTNAILA